MAEKKRTRRVSARDRLFSMNRQRDSDDSEAETEPPLRRSRRIAQRSLRNNNQAGYSSSSSSRSRSHSQVLPLASRLDELMGGDSSDDENRAGRLMDNNFIDSIIIRHGLDGNDSDVQFRFPMLEEREQSVRSPANEAPVQSPPTLSPVPSPQVPNSDNSAPSSPTENVSNNRVAENQNRNNDLEIDIDQPSTSSRRCEVRIRRL